MFSTEEIKKILKKGRKKSTGSSQNSGAMGAMGAGSP
jgi:hypothetical protein